MSDDHKNDAIGPPGSWTMWGIFIMSLVILIATGFIIYTYSGSRTTTAVNSPAQTGFAPIIDEVRPVPSTTGQGGGERR